jgi:hypothetical protein
VVFGIGGFESADDFRREVGELEEGRPPGRDGLDEVLRCVVG